MSSVLKNRKAAILFLMPALALYTAIVFVPILCSVYYSFFQWNGLSGMTFIGMDNYVELFTRDKVVWPVLLQTIVYTILQILFQVGGGLLLALLLTLLVKKRAVFQTIYYIPVVISSVAVCQIFDKLFSVTPTGLINHLLSFFSEGLGMTEWLTTPGLSLVHRTDDPDGEAGHYADPGDRTYVSDSAAVLQEIWRQSVGDQFFPLPGREI